MKNRLVKWAYLINNKQGFFLLSLVLLLVGNLFFSKSSFKLDSILLLFQNMLCGFLFIDKRAFTQRLFLIFMMLITVLLMVGVSIGMALDLEKMGSAIFVFYFLFISYFLFRDLYFVTHLNREAIYGAFNGFIILSFVGGISFALLENNIPNSFSNIENPTLFAEFIYFSFITLMTVGYGDIVPLTDFAKKLVVIVALAGHFYTVFVTAIIVSKFGNSTGK